MLSGQDIAYRAEPISQETQTQWEKYYNW